MKSLFTRQGLVVSLTLAGIVAFVAIYLFKYVPENEQKLKARRFRALERTQINLESKIRNSFQFLETQLHSYTDEKNGGPTIMDNYLNSLSKNNAGFTLGKVYRTHNRAEIDSGLKQVMFENDSVRCTSRLPKSEGGIALQINYGSESFIRSLLPKNLFDEFILIKDSSLLFATFPTGNQKIKPDSLLHFMTSLPVSSEGDAHFAGQQYKIFLQPLKVDSKSQWILGGLLQEKRFVNERSQLDPKKVLSLITISIILLILLPWIKLFFMGNRDRLTHTDGFLSFVVAMLLMCMIYFVFARRLPDNDNERALKTLSESIGKAFSSEIRTAKDLLNRFDHTIVAQKSFRKNITCLNDKCNSEKAVSRYNMHGRTFATQDQDILKSFSGDLPKINFHYVFWLDNDGKELYNWTNLTTIRPRQQFKDRRYFKAHQNKNGNVVDTVLDQVFSWTTGEFRTVISKPSNLPGASVVAISMSIRSMEDHILPEGFTAMIINWKGDVLYHSDKSHNLNEYLPEEFEDSSKLKSAIYSRSIESFTVGYHGSKYDVLCKPIEPSYFLLVMRNQSFENTRDINAFSFALSMYGVFFIIILLQYICMVSLFSSKSGLHFKSRLVDTLFPSKSLQPAYRCAAIGNLFMIAMLAFFSQAGLSIHIYILLSAVAVNTIFINLVCARQHGLHNNYRMASIKQKNAAVITAFLLLYNLAVFQFTEGETEFYRLFLFEGYIVVGLALLYAWFYSKGSLRNRHVAGTGFIKSYAWMAVTRIIITSGIPVLFFYIDAYNYEQGLQTRRAQKQFGFRYARSLRTFPGDSIESGNRFFIDSSLISASTFVKRVVPFKQDFSLSDLDTRLFNELRLLDDSISIANNNLYSKDVVQDAGVFYGDTCFIRPIPAKEGHIVVRSSEHRLLLFPAVENVRWSNWLMLIAALIVFYHTIKLILDRIFAIQFTAQSTAPDVDLPGEEPRPEHLPDGLPFMERKLLDKTGCLGNQRRFSFIVATAGAGTAEAINHIRQDKNILKKIFVLDLYTALHSTSDSGRSTLEEASDNKYPCLLIDHFEYLLHNNDLHDPLIGLLEKWNHRDAASISIISSLHPVDFHDRLCEYPESIKNADPQKAATLQEYAFRWEDLLGQFDISFMGMKRLKPNQGESSGLLRFLQQELQWGDFLHQCFNQYKNEHVQTTASKTGSTSTEALPAAKS